MKLNAKALGLAFGIIWGVAILIVTFVSMWTNYSYGRDFLNGLVSIYPGFSISYGGAILGLIYGFVDGFIFAWLLAMLYNLFAKEK
jgi:hypothetical protein